jgi:hypothetical protein
VSTESVIDSTSTRVLLEVPSPATSLSLGEFSTSSGYNGVSVDTVSHARFYGKGGSSASDVVGQATGHVWLQSMNRVSALAQRNVLVASRDRTQIVAQKGVNLFAGFSAGNIASEGEPGSMPSSVSSYESSANIASSVATGIDAAGLVVSAIMKGVLSVASSQFAWATAMSGVSANLTGAALNIASLGWARDVDLPGINLYSSGFFTVGSARGSVSLTGVAGLLLASPFVSLAGLITTKITGAFHTSMNAIGPVDILAGDRVTIRGWLGVQVASRTGTFTGRGKTINLGTPIPFVKPPQINTLSVTMNALKSITLSSLVNTTISSLAGYQSTAMDHEIDATLGTSMQVAGIWKLEVTPMGIAAKGPATSLEIGPTGVVLSGPGGVSKAELGVANVSLQSGAGSLKIVPGASVAIDGVKLDIK